MKRLLGRTLPLLLVLATACKLDPATRPVARATGARPASPAATAATVASAASRVLVRGQAAARTLTGTVVVDAGYIVSQGAGNVLTVDGQQVVGAGNLITNDGGSLIGNDGGSIVSQGAGNLITNDGGGLITNDGASLVADDGTTLVANGIVSQGAGNIVSQGAGNIVSQGAGNIVSQGAGNIVSQGAGNRRLLGTASVPARGTQLPAAGMVISVVSLDTHKYVPLGRNAAGKPVYSVYSNAKGGYTIYPEAAADENLLVVTSAPGTRDAHSSLNVLDFPQSPDALKLADQTALASKFLRVAFASQIKRLILEPVPPGVPVCDPSDAQKSLIAFLTPEYVDKLRRLAWDGRAYALDKDTANRLVLETADLLLARIDLFHTQTIPNQTRKDVAIPPEAKDLQPEPLMPAVLDALEKGRLKAGTDPSAFGCGGPNQVQLDRVCKLIKAYTLPPPVFAGPYDLADFAVNQLLWTGDREAVDGVGDLLAVAGVQDARREQFRLIGALTGIMYAVAQAADDGFKQRMADKVATFRVPDPSKAASPVPIPSGSCVSEHTLVSP